MSSLSIHDFWCWFESNVDRISEAYDQADAVWLKGNIGPQVKQLRQSLNWEIGPYHHPDRTLVISPLSREDLPLTREVVALAPDLEGWHFLHAKPAKELLSLEFRADGQIIIADDWYYQLTAFNGGEFVDIDLYVDRRLRKASMVCELVVEALLGEEIRLEKVGRVTPHTADFVEVPDSLTEMKYLREHVAEIFAAD